MIQYNEVIATNLDGMGPVDWKVAQEAFSVAGFKPEKLKIVPRNAQLRGLVDVGGEAAIEKMMADDEALRFGTNAQRMLRLIARQYNQLANKGARLPKFSKWVTSLFKDDREMHNELAKYGQGVPKAPFVISCNPVDILRAADTKHFWSCLDDNGGYKDVLPGVVEKCPGIALAYVNGPDGKMKGRIWIHSAKDDKNKPILLLASNRYGSGLDHGPVAEYLATKGYDVYKVKPNYYDAPERKLEFVDCFKQNIHWDTYTWNKCDGELLAKAK